MGPKKGLSAFIKKQKTTKEKKTTGTEEESSAPTTGDQIKLADAEVQQTQKPNSKNTPANKKAESSDEEEDELELAGQMSHGNIKEYKDVAKDKSKESGWDMAKLDEEKAVEESKTTDTKAQPGEKKAFGEGTSWSKPRFGRKAPVGGTKFGGNDFAALDELDDETSGKKRDIKARADPLPEHRVERQREEPKAAPVKPTFRGRMNAKTGGGAQEDQATAGVGKAYDFGVVYKSEIPDGERREFGGEQKRRPQKDKGIELNSKLAQDEKANDDDDFIIVRNKDKKPKRFTKQDNSDSSSDDGGQGPSRTRGGGDFSRGARVERGGNRGDRGGFYKSSNATKQQ